MSEDQRPILPQLLILLREDEEQLESERAEAPVETAPEPRRLYELPRRERFRKAG